MDAAPSPDHGHKTITQRAGLVALGTLVSRLLGLGRDLVLAALFSRSATDAFMIAFQLPNLLRQLLAEGAVQTAVLPVLAEQIGRDGPAGGRRYFRAIRGLSVLALLIVSGAGVLFAPQLVELFAGGFRERPEQFELAVGLTRWVFPYIFFMGTTALGAAALNTEGRFAVTSFAPLLLNVAFIGSAFLLRTPLESLGIPGVYSMVLGALLGGVLQMVAQWPSLKKAGYFELPSFEFRHPAVRETLRRLAPSLFGIGIYYLDVMLGRRMLSGLHEGAVTYYGFALRLCDFPQGIFVMALQAATLPSLAKLVAAREMKQVAETFAFSIRLSMFVGILGAAGTMFFATPIVRLLLERGAFQGDATLETARALAAQAPSILLVALVRPLVSVFFALGDTRSPVIVAALDLIAFVGSGWLLSQELGHVGISWAVSIAAFVQMALLWVLLERKLPIPGRNQVARAFLSLLIAAALAGFGAKAAHTALDGALGAEFSAVSTILSLGIMVIAYIALARLFGFEELKILMSPLLRRIGFVRSKARSL